MLEEQPQRIQISGDLDESADFSSLEFIQAGVWVVDLEHVERINSMGLRKWIFWTRGLNQAQLVFKNCPPAVVHQMNILQGFLPARSVVESFYVPYHCPHCNYESRQLAQRRQDFVEGTADRPSHVALSSTRTCPQCHKEMEWDLVEKLYFRFLQYRAQRSQL